MTKRLGKGFLLCLVFSCVSVAFASIFNQAPSRGPSRNHDGYDYPTNYGTPVPSRSSGVVSLVGSRGGYGKTVAVDKGSCREIYAHFSSISVSPGQRVSSGTVLGLAGRSGLVALSQSSAVVHYESCSSLYPAKGAGNEAPRRGKKGRMPLEGIPDHMFRDPSGTSQ